MKILHSCFKNDDQKHYRVEISLSPGAVGDPINDFEPDKPLNVQDHEIISKLDLTCDEFREYISHAIDFAKK